MKSKVSDSKTRKKTSARKPAPGKAVGNNTQADARLFKDQAAWSAWLDKNHERSSGVWLRLAKKNSGLQSVTYAEALEAALCYGWIDGHKRPESDQAWLQRFCPRSAKSIWSRINREKARALVKSGRMMPAGQQAIEQALSNGRWESAYDSPSRASVPDDFQAALKLSPKAKSFFETLDRANRYAILFRIQTAKKPETRARNIQKFVAMLERGEKIH
ncbi:MAG TPA: YdeI/OmpD-associated family protein [Terriglobales bacterium]|jgi:uncharacterized protein YdeI (YjbR/CyaY-like superfamily)|nr:YdeI/OmpD-associated family protein [Terriglobales bacterium]